MGAGSSVGNDATTARTSSGHEDVAGGVTPTAEEFEACAKLLTSKYHDLRLRSGGGVSSEGGAAPSSVLENGVASSTSLRSRSLTTPLPRAERKRLSRQLRRHSTAEQNNEEVGGTAVAASTAGESQSSGINGRHDGETSSEADFVTNARESDTAGRETPGESQPDTFVHRDEMVGLARDLGYNVTPEQSTEIFDMLDSRRQGRISKDDLSKHLLPLLQKVGRSGPPKKGSTGRRKSTKESPPRRPRPSTSHPSGTKTPPRPAGTPPPTAKRRNVSLPPPEGRRRSSSAGPASSSPPKGRKGKITGTLNPISSPNHLRERPSKFWLTSRRSGGGDAPASTSLTLLGDAVEKVDESQLWRDKNTEQVEKRDRDLSGGVAEGEKGVVAPGGRTGGELESANGLSVGIKSKKSTDGSEDGQNDFADEKRGVEASAAKEGGSRSERCSTTTNSDPAAADLLVGKNVVDWTAADVRAWVRALPRGLAAFAGAEAFTNGRVDGKKLATLTLSDIKRKEFHHAKFKAKIPTALWVEIKQIQQTAPIPAVGVAVPSRFSPGQTIVDEAVRTPLCTVKQSVGQGAFGEVYQVVWTGIGSDRGTTMAMKTVRLGDISSNERDEYRVLLMEEILTAIRVKPHPNLVNVRFAHIMGFCSESEEYFCFEDFVTGRNLEEIIAEGKGELHDGTPAEVQGRLLSYSIQLLRGLGHIHRCGVLHQDIKSANIMVSSDAVVFITDFGFATVGHFGPPPPMIEKPTLGPAAAATTDVVPKLTGSDVAEARACGGAVSSAHSQSGAVDTNSGGLKGSRKSSGRIPDGGVDGGPYAAPTATPGGHENPPTIGSRCDGMDGSIITPAKSRQQAKTGTSGSVPAAEDAQGVSGPGDQGSAGKGGAREGAGEYSQSIGGIESPPTRHSVLYGTLKGYTPRYQSPEVSAIIDEKTKAAAAAAAAAAQAGGHPSQNQAPQDPSPSRASRNHDVVDVPHTPFTHRSDMWAAGVVVLEMYAGGLAGLTAGRGENAFDLLETLVRNTAGITTPIADSGGVAGEQTKEGVPSASGKEGRPSQPGAPDGAGKGATGGNRGKINRDTLRADMPEGVVAVLREIFQWEAGDRPVSVEVLAARLSQTLGLMLKENLAVVPCPTTGAPSPSSLCEEAAVFVECDENHAKVGRLHMWLGKALFLKGEDRRDQALQEYREGVRVLEESKADRRSPSMALFRWYLGKALLETGEIDEALPHLTEAVSIDPENAKYRHTLGLAKCVTGDEAGARDDLLEAALLDEEDAEDRYQLRMQRIREKRRIFEEEQRALRESQEAGEAGASQGASWPTTGDSEAGCELQQAATITKNESPSATSGLAQSQLLALEKASASTRTYALEKLGDYRSTRVVGRGGGELRGGRGATMDPAGIHFGGNSLRDAATLPEVRRFSLGDEIVCAPYASATPKPLEPLRCCRSSSHVGHDDDADNDETFVIDGLLSPYQASLQFWGEAYTATAANPARRRRQNSGESAGTGGSLSYHVVYVRFEPDKSRPVAATPTSPTAEASSLTASNGGKQLAPIDEKQLKVHGAGGVSTYSSPVEAATAASAPAAGVSSGASSSSKPRRSLSPMNRPPLVSSAHFQREEEFVPMLKAVGRAAMVGFHAQLAGTLHQLTWGGGELTLVANSIPANCFTLREACVSGNLYRGTGMVTAGGGQGHRASGEAQNASVVVDRILELARQTAAAISHCHCRGVLLRDITPNDVLVTPYWKAILRPNYSHAHAGKSWSTISVLEQQQHCQYFKLPCGDSDGEPVTAPFTNATSSDYQSPEIARIRSENEPRQRRSGRARRRTAEATSSLSPGRASQEEPQHSPLSPTGLRPSTTPEPTGAGECGPGGRDSVKGGSGGGGGGGGGGGDDGAAAAAAAARGARTHSFDNMAHDLRESNAGSGEDQPQADGTKRGGAVHSRLDRQQGGADNAGENLRPSLSSSPSGDIASIASGGGSGGPPMVSACESDIWAWALMVLQMFSDEAWPQGNGQKGLVALEALLQRRQGVDVWTTEDVVSWLRDIGLWSEKTEREIRVHNIAGPQLLVPTCRRDVVEKLGLFFTDVELSCKFWESIAGGLQRWSVPPRLARVLRKCLADLPGDRFSTMDEVCKLLRGIAAGDAHDGDTAALPTTNDDADNVASDRLRTGMILNDIGVCLCGKGQTEEAERYYKMALLSSDDVVEAYYNLGLLYIKPAFSKFREAQQVFDAATERMSDRDPRRRACIEHSNAAERKSNYHQSEEMMKALSGKYGSISPKGSRNRGSAGGGGGEGTIGGTARNNRGVSDDSTDSSRWKSFPPEKKLYSSSSSKSLASPSRSSASDAKTSPGMGVEQVSPPSRSPSRARTPSKAFC